MKKSLLVVLLTLFASLPVLSAAGSSEYYPMLVEGRTWKYTVQDIYLYHNPDAKTSTCSIKIEGDTVIDGLSYVKFYEYEGGSLAAKGAKPIFCAREDCEAREVYVTALSDYFRNDLLMSDEPQLLYDFKSADKNLLCNYIWSSLGIDKKPTDAIEVALKNGVTVNGWKYQAVNYIGNPGSIIEGIGWYFLDSEMDRIWFGTLIGPSMNVDLTGMSYPNCHYLYAVCEADGTEIFAIEEHRPEVMGLEAVRAEGADSEAAAVYYRFDGVRFDRRPTEPGIYIRVAGGEVSKVVI